MPTRLERKCVERVTARFQMSGHGKIDAIAPRRLGPLCCHAHQLRISRNAAQNERGKFREPPSDAEVDAVVFDVMRELERLA